MLHRKMLVAVAVAAAVSAGPAAAQTEPSVTATGTGQARVVPKNRHNNASIVAAYEAARRKAVSGALKDARAYAQLYAQQTGLTLGAIISVTDASNANGPGGFQFFGPFGPNQFCGTLQIGKVRVVKGKKKVTMRREHRCFVPEYAFSTLSVTYAATPTPATSG